MMGTDTTITTAYWKSLTGLSNFSESHIAGTSNRDEQIKVVDLKKRSK